MLLLNPAMCHASVEVQFYTHVTFVLKQFGMCIHVTRLMIPTAAGSAGGRSGGLGAAVACWMAA